jgi:hypothetical protein
MTLASLHWKDEANLTWFYGKGQTLFERSPLGGMLDRAEAFHQPYCSRGAISARPTAEYRNVVVHAPDNKALEMYGAISRMLMLLERRSALCCAVLEALYGDLGARWAPTRVGRLAAVYHLTEAGRRLLEADDRERVAKKQPPATLAPHLRMANELEGPRDGKSVSRERADRRRVGLMRCERQAMELRAQACASWNAVKSEQRGRAA